MAIFLENEYKNSISFEIQKILEKVSVASERFGAEIFLIGGIVRDILLANKIADIDIAVQANAIEFCRFLEKNIDCHIISVQENLKTAKVEFENSVIIDFASTREEDYSKSGVLPIAHNFGCKLKEDVKRRDFTINTLAIKLTGTDKFSLIDYYNGFQDLKNKKIRILHEKSFIDDPSRIIRALKFKKRFNFDIEDCTYDLMQHYLIDVDREMPLERIKNELKQYFSIKKDSLYQDIINTNAYKLISDNPILDFQDFNFERIKNLKEYNTSNKWFLYFLVLIVKSDFAIKRLNLTGLELKILQELKTLLKSDVCETSSNQKIYFSFCDLIQETLVAYYLISGNKAVMKFLKELKTKKVLISGKDLIQLGLKPSPFFNEILQKVLVEKLNGNLQTKEDEIAFVKQFVIENNLL